jgi:hypothetical protein
MIYDNQKKIEFAEKFLDEYLGRGFGVLTKRDTDLLVFHLLSELGGLDSHSNHNLSLKLRISTRKIANYRLDRRLRYNQLTEEQVKLNFLESLKKSAIKINNTSKWILLSIEDSYVRESIKAKLKELNHFSDSSFNAEIISLDTEAFSDLLSDMYKDLKIDKKQYKELNKHASDIAKDKSGNITVKGIFKAFLEGAAKDGGKRTISAGLSFLTGGASDISQIISKVKEYFSE